MKIGSLFAGYGGLDMAVEQAFPGARPAWFCEWDDAPSKVLAHHWPDVPNLRDVTAVDWSQVEPVDIIAGGFPCQDVSHAGRRQGLIRDGDGKTRSGLWGEMLKAIDTIRPSLVVAENVRGLLSAEADSDVEPCPFCMGDGGASPMRALGAVLADLADIGFDAAWCGLQAAEVGAAHGRFRVFILAWPAADSEGAGAGGYERGVRAGAERGSHWRQEAEGLTLLPTPLANDFSDDISTLEERQARGYGSHLRDIPLLLPTPTTADHGTDAPGRTGSPSLSTDFVTDLLPTPDANMGVRGQQSESALEAGNRQTTLNDFPRLTRWRDYAPAIARWERVLGRAVPDPTEPGPKGNPRLSPRFVEWLMGLPAGHVTDPAIGLTRNQQLKALGNGVVPQQGAAALEWLLSVGAVTA